MVSIIFLNKGIRMALRLKISRHYLIKLFSTVREFQRIKINLVKNQGEINLETHGTYLSQYFRLFSFATFPGLKFVFIRFSRNLSQPT